MSPQTAVPSPPQRRRRLWVLTNAGLVSILIGVVAATLNGRVRDVAMPAPLSAATGPSAAIPVPVSNGTVGGITRSAALRLARAVPAGLEEIRLRVDTYGTSPRLAAGTLTLADACIFDARPGTLTAGAAVAFHARKPCSALAVDAPATLSMRFDERTVQDARCGLLAAELEGDAHFFRAEFNGREYALLGDYIMLRSEAVMTRAELLAYVWQLGSGQPRWIWIAVASSGVLLALASLLPGGASAASGAVRTGAAAGAAAFSIAALYAVLVPPFQGPDEPSHFLGYAYVTENPPAAAAAERWAQLTHFQRIRFNPDERFRPGDVGAPYQGTWDLVSTQDFARSSVTVRLWRAMAPILRTHSVPRQLLELRLLNALVFALAAALLGAALWYGGVRSAASIIALPLFIPTVPFLAMHVSNYGPATAAYVLIAGGVGLLVVDSPQAAVAGVLLGVGAALAFASTHSAVPMLLLLAAVLSARIVLGTPAALASSRVRPALLFWAGVGGGMLLLAVLITEWQALRYQQEFARGAGWMGNAYRFAAAQRLVLGAAAILGGFCAELLCSALRTRAGRALDRGAAVARTISRATAITIAAVLAASVFLPMPTLHPARPGTTMAAYVWQAVAASATMLRLRHHDPLLAVSFWSGLGWLDTIPPYVTTLLAFATGIAAIAAFATRASARSTAWLGTATVAALMTVAVYAAAALRLSPDLHGRYVMGAYLTGVYAVWLTAVAIGPREGGGPDLRGRAAAALLVMVAVASNALSLATILTRYF